MYLRTLRVSKLMSFLFCPSNISPSFLSLERELMSCFTVGHIGTGEDALEHVKT